MPKGLLSVGNSAFKESSVRLVILSSTIQEILTQAFYASQLEYIEIPQAVTKLYTASFWNCTKLSLIKFNGSVPPVIANVNAFYNLPSSCKIFVPKGSLQAYKSATNYPDSETYEYIEY